MGDNWILWAALCVGVFLVILYNRLVALRQARRAAFSDVDVHLKQRCDLIPNLVETAKGYAAHEAGVFDRVTAARAAALRGGPLNARLQAESDLSGAMMNLMAVAENYPQLRANESFGRLQAELSDLENKIAAARRFFNNATSEYNAAIAQFPAILFARVMGFREEIFFEMDAQARTLAETPPKVGF